MSPSSRFFTTAPGSLITFYFATELAISINVSFVTLSDTLLSTTAHLVQLKKAAEATLLFLLKYPLVEDGILDLR